MNDVRSYEGPWVKATKPVGAADHLHYVNEAIDGAVNEVTDPDEGPFEVQLLVHVSHTSPGWVDGYKVILKGAPGA
jgi:hypothetical protein